MKYCLVIVTLVLEQQDKEKNGNIHTIRYII
jgi:hypothetical protein